jgi:hypothetical protein
MKQTVNNNLEQSAEVSSSSSDVTSTMNTELLVVKLPKLVTKKRTRTRVNRANTKHRRTIADLSGKNEQLNSFSLIFLGTFRGVKPSSLISVIVLFLGVKTTGVDVLGVFSTEGDVLGMLSLGCVFDSPALHSKWLLLLKIEISLVVNFCFITNQNELKS